MATDSVILRIRDARETRVRYKRANLTITRWGGLNHGPLGQAIAEYEKGEITEDKLCLAFTKSRVKSHTSSFRWQDADSDRVLDLVVAASTDPRLASSAPESVAQVLVEAAEEEREIAAEARDKFQRSIRALFPFEQGAFVGLRAGFGSLDWSKHFASLNTAGFARTALQRFAETSTTQFLARETSLKLGSTFLARETARDVLSRINPGRSFLLANGAAMEIIKTHVGAMNLGSQLRDQILAGQLHFKPLIDSASLNQTISSVLNRDWAHQFKDLFQPKLAIQDLGRKWIENLKRALPRNWRELEPDEIDQAAELMAQTGLSLAWVPQPEVIRSILSARSHEERCAILLSNADLIISEVEEVLSEVTFAELQSTTAACKEAIATYRDGHPAPAQAYASAALTNLVHEFLGYDDFSKVRQIFSKDPQKVAYNAFPRHVVGQAWVRTFDRFERAGDGFNRNLTAHRIGPPYYTEPNLLMVLMLLAGLTREFQRLASPAQDHELVAA